MKLHPESTGFYNTVTRYGPGFVEINEVHYETGVLLAPEGPVIPWDVTSFDSLNSSHFEAIAAMDPELVLVGTGERLRFVHPRLQEALTRRRIGLESMDTAAACRTYNILMAEGRKVVAALIIGEPQ